MLKPVLILTLLYFFSCFKSSGQQTKEITLKWSVPKSEQFNDALEKRYLSFEGATYNSNYLPNYHQAFQNIAISEANLINITTKSMSKEEAECLDEQVISSAFEISFHVSYHAGKAVSHITTSTIRKSENGFEKLISFNFSYRTTEIKKNAFQRSSRNATNSVLANGTWLKIAILADGIYSIDKSWFDGLGFDIGTIAPNNIRVFGNGGAMLPELNKEFRADDLTEIAIQIKDNGDAKWDENESVIFYGQGPHRWLFNGADYRYQVNLYSDTNYYFLTWDGGTGTPKRIQGLPIQTSANKSFDYFWDLSVYEQDLVNVIGTGKMWLDQPFGINDRRSYQFNIPNVLTTPAAKAFGRYFVRPIGVGGQSVNIGYPDGTNLRIPHQSITPSYEGQFGLLENTVAEFALSKSKFDVVVSFDNKGSSQSELWLDKLEFNAPRKLLVTSGTQFFRNHENVGIGNTTEFSLEVGYGKAAIWCVTQHENVKNINFNRSSTVLTFNEKSDSLNEYVVFDQENLPIPSFVGRVANQNLHAMPQVEMLIVTHPLFIESANDLADFHRKQDGLSVNVVNVNEVYNEYSSGKKDIVGIRDFVKMFYNRSGGNPALIPKYLLLIGDGSYDPKDRVVAKADLIPTFQSENSSGPTSSYTSDDFYVLLDADEGSSTADGEDLSVGRFPVNTADEAKGVVEKIKNYNSIASKGDWRNLVTLVADDEDDKVHMIQADGLASILENSNSNYNANKIYLDAYKQVVSAGGKRYPDARDELIRSFERGSLILKYVGHGGGAGWSHERLFQLSDITELSNKNRLPLLLTATCEFSRFDSPLKLSGGELVFSNPSGGAIGLLTTTRLVYSFPNYVLTQKFTENSYKKLSNDEWPRLGDLLLITKRNSDASINSRNFTLLGDPALRLAYPQQQIFTNTNSDTIRALQKVKLSGSVLDENGQIDKSFNGLLTPTIFDKPDTIITLNNDGIEKGPFTFNALRNRIFRGNVTVNEGEFEFEFVVPKDINKTFGNGKVSHYAQSESSDGSGHSFDLIIGGIDTNAPEDNQGPTIDMFMNDEGFVSGGITNSDPILIANLFDENGINTIGSGVGHDLVAIIDGNTSNPIVLNDLYEAKPDSYQSGKVTYNFKGLEAGKHTLTLKVWDVYNNPSDQTIEFNVVDNDGLVLDNVLNYPNPFTTKTGFYFEHNQPGVQLSTRLQVFTVAGNLVKEFVSDMSSTGYRIGPIEWDGRDEYGDKMGRGVYLYRLSVSTPNGLEAEEFERLVILN